MIFRILVAGWLAAAAASNADVTGAALENQGWPYYRGDQKGTGYSSLAQIRADNVQSLKLAWQFQTGDLEKRGAQIEHSAFQATPILLPEVAGQSLVFCTPFNEVIALDPVSGESRWRFDAGVEKVNPRPSKCRGVSWWLHPNKHQGEACWQRIYHATHDRRLVALDALTGKPCDDFGESGQIRLYSKEQGYKAGDIASSSAPVIVNNHIVVGSAVVDFQRAQTPQGTVQAYRADTGKAAWTFHMLPQPDTSDEILQQSWPADPANVSGSANAWAPMSVDETRGLVFVPTSSPSPDFFGGQRPGNNLNANSLLALNGDTGELVWRYQFVHHDLWDYDTPAQPLLIDLPVQGQLTPVVVQVTKQGFVFVLHRETGEPVFPVDEVPVSQAAVVGEWLSPTQPRPRFPEPLMTPNLRPDNAWGFSFWDRGACREQLEGLFNEGLFTPVQLDRWTALMPGSLGGANWGGAVYWPEKNTLYVNVNTAPFKARLVKTQQEKTAAHLPKSGKVMQISMKGTPYTIENGALVSPLGAPCTPPPWGKLMALNLETGQLGWQSPLGSIHQMGPVPLPFQVNWGTPNLGGALVTQGGLVFIGATMDRLFRAFDAHSGEVLWDYSLPSDATASPMTYAIDGKQYVVIAAGGHHMFGRPMGDSIMAFSLDDQSPND